jgi:hypothetical protein
MISFPFYWVEQNGPEPKISRLLIREPDSEFPRISPQKPLICKSCLAEPRREDTRLIVSVKGYVEGRLELATGDKQPGHIWPFR